MGIGRWFKGTDTKESNYTYITKMPAFGDKGLHVRVYQQALKAKGFDLSVDDRFGAETMRITAAFQRSIGSAGSGIPGPVTLEALGLKVEEKDKPARVPNTKVPVNPAYVQAKKYAGKKETDKEFNKKMSGFWKKAGLSLTTIIGSGAAWCGLFIFVMNTEVGQKSVKYSPLARNWGAYEQKVDWKRDGIPQGAVVHINNGGNCSSSSNNHVTFADGSCTPEYLAKKGAVVPGFGGNQGDMVKRSEYAVTKVCNVRWPAEIMVDGELVKVPLPPKVTKNVSCGSGSDQGESTR